MCATQVHFNIRSESTYRILPELYGKEYLVPLLFSNSKETHFGHCARLLAWQASCPENKTFWGIPIPTSSTAYSERLSQCTHLCRDYSYISPRELGTFEFRSCCSQDKFSNIAEMIALRVGILMCAFNSSSSGPAGGNEADTQIKNHFNQVCLTGLPDPRRLARDYADLRNIAELLPKQWRLPLAPSLKRLSLLSAKAEE